MWPDKRLTEMLGVEHPIIQAPMAGSSSLEMAVAVTEAGGLGSLACAAMDAEALEAALAEATRRTDGALNVNFFAHSPPAPDAARDAGWLRRLAPYYRESGAEPTASLSVGGLRPFDTERCAVIEAFRPKMVSFHFGLPHGDLLQRLKAAGVLLMASATTVEEARWLVAQGCDAVIAQGAEAGGHRGMFQTEDVHSQVGTLALTPQIADAVAAPVISAGGIADGRGIAAAFALGAAGAQIGTAYLFTDEATIDPLYRRALETAEAGDTVVTNVFSGRPTRCVANRLTREAGPISAQAPAFPRGFEAIAPLRRHDAETGDRAFSPHYCGQAVGLGRTTGARIGAGELTRRLADDAQRRLRALAPP